MYVAGRPRVVYGQAGCVTDENRRSYVAQGRAAAYLWPQARLEREGNDAEDWQPVANAREKMLRCVDGATEIKSVIEGSWLMEAAVGWNARQNVTPPLAASPHCKSLSISVNNRTRFFLLGGAGARSFPNHAWLGRCLISSWRDYQSAP